MRSLLVLLAAQCLVGCSIYSSDHQTHYVDAEGRVPAHLFTRLSQQSVSKSWLLKQLGQPKTVDSLGQGAQVYTWPLTRTEIRHRAVFMLYKSQRTKTQQNFLHIVYSGDESLKYWLDREAQVDTQALLTSRDLQRLAVSNLEKTAYSPPERPVFITHPPAQEE